MQGSQGAVVGERAQATDVLEQIKREEEIRYSLERQIDHAINEINANPAIDSQTKDALISNLRSLKNGLGVNPNLAQVQKEINDARAIAYYTSTSAALYDSLSLSSQLAVNDRLAAIDQGRIADYYFSVTDPDNLYSIDSKKHIGALIEADPENKQLVHTMQGFTKDQKTSDAE